MTWASLEEALESVGAPLAFGLEIDLTDPDGIMPDTPGDNPWRSSRTLRLTSQDWLNFDSSQAGSNLPWSIFEPCVLDWGVFDELGEMSTADQGISNVQVTVANRAVSTQEVRSDIGGTVPVPPLEPVAESLKFEDLFGLWNWDNAPARFYVFVSPDGSFDTNGTGVQQILIWSGQVRNYTSNHSEAVLDLVVKQDAMDGEGHGRSLSDSPDETVRDQYAPVTIGRYGYETHEMNSWTQEELFAIGKLPRCAPMILLREERRASQTEIDRDYIWHDPKGPNAGWVDQPQYGTATGAPDDNDRIIEYDIGSETISRTLLQAGAPIPGYCQWLDLSPNPELVIRNNSYFKSIGFPRVFETVGSNGVFEADRVFDKNPFSFMRLDCSSTANYIDLKISPMAAAGRITRIRGFAVVDSVGSGFTVEHGLWNPNLGPGQWLGAAGAPGVATNITAATPRGIILSSGAANLLDADGKLQPAASWEWQWSTVGGGAGARVNDDICMRFKVATVGLAATLHIYSAGIYVEYDNLTNGAFRPRQKIRETGDLVFQGSTIREWLHQAQKDEIGRDPEVSRVQFYACPSKAALDNATGDITGAAGGIIRNAADAANYVLRSRGKNVTASDIQVGGGVFGSFEQAVTDLKNWVDPYTLNVNSQSGDVRRLLNEICAEAPMMVYREPSDGVYRCVVYPHDIGSIGPHMYFRDSDNNPVQFGPPEYRQGMTRDDSRFRLQAFDAVPGLIENVYTDFELKFSRFAPSGVYSETVKASPDGQTVYTGGGNQYTTTPTGPLVTLCQRAETLLGTRPKPYTFFANFIADPYTANKFLEYLVRRLTVRRLGITGQAETDTTLLRKGHIVQVHTDMGAIRSVPKYNVQSWNNLLFMVNRVSRVPIRNGYRVTFTAEEVR